MDYLIHILSMVAIYSVLAISLNMVVGYTGLLSVCHAAFYGIGAYAVAILLSTTGVSFFGALLIGVAISGVCAFLIGLVLSKFRDDYYALASLGFNTVIYALFLNWEKLTRGPLGISRISRPEFFGTPLDNNAVFFVLMVFIAVGVYLIARRFAQSSFGRVLKAIREDEDAIKVFGYRTHQYKLAIFVVSAMLAAIAGGLLATYISYIDPGAFTINESIFVLAIIILGGLADLNASILGAVVLVFLPELLRLVGFPNEFAAQLRQLIYGAILTLLMLYRPQGISGKYKL